MNDLGDNLMDRYEADFDIAWDGDDDLPDFGEMKEVAKLNYLGGVRHGRKDMLLLAMDVEKRRN